MSMADITVMILVYKLYISFMIFDLYTSSHYHELSAASRPHQEQQSRQTHQILARLVVNMAFPWLDTCDIVSLRQILILLLDQVAAPKSPPREMIRRERHVHDVSSAEMI